MTGAEARPVEDSERLVLLDALRGFALCGIFLSNTTLWFSGQILLSRAQAEAALAAASWADTLTHHAVAFLVFGKFIPIFSFLFGLGFAVQMGRAEARGASIASLYARRLGVLLVLGLSHLFLLWCGDILSTYAVLGFWLLLFRGLPDRRLLVWAAVLIFVMPVVSFLWIRLPQLLAAPEAAAFVASTNAKHSAALQAQTLSAFAHGGYVDMVRANAAYYLRDVLKAQQVLLLFTLLGLFLLGLVAGRRRLFPEAAQHLPLFRKLLLWGLVAGALGCGAETALQQLLKHKVLSMKEFPWLHYVRVVVRDMGEMGLAAFYISGFTLLFQRAFWQRLLSVLAPVGRMALSNYLSQTVLSLFIYDGWGLGLIGKQGPARCVGIALGIFSLQVLWSHLWLARFRFGPAEWLWRSLTYGQAQPMRRAPTPHPAPV